MAVSIFQMPLTNSPQTFQLTMAGKDYIVTCRWNNAPDAGWILDFSDLATNTPIVTNIPLITGADLLVGLEYLGFNGQLYVYTDGDPTAVPTFTNLGVESNVYFGTVITSG